MEKFVVANAIEEVIKQTAKDILTLLNNGALKDKRLICPKDEKGALRISEQEFKQLFIENICKQTAYNYSTETPSYYAYNFSDKKNPKIFGHDKISKNSPSARVDLTLYENECKFTDCDKKYHIEFKNEQVSENSIKKDILKLAFEPNKKSYFIHTIIRNDNKLREKTVKAIEDKFIRSYAYAKDNYGNQFSVQAVTVVIVFIYGEEGERQKKIRMADFSAKSDVAFEDVKP